MKRWYHTRRAGARAGTRVASTPGAAPTALAGYRRRPARNGLSPTRAQHLFERFYQAHASTHRSGLGLGLYISREIVVRHGGEIAADFPPDGGTHMVVTLPLRSSTAHGDTAEADRMRPAV